MSTLSKKSIALYSIFLIIIAAAPIFASSGYGFLSYFSTMLLPFLWFSIGRRFNASRIRYGLYAIGCLLLFGLAIERSNALQGLFPYIGYAVGNEVGQRYGSFTLNPLGLGYFSAIVGIIALGEEKIKIKFFVLCCAAVLLSAANSRGAFITFATGFSTYLLINGFASKGRQRNFITLAVLATLAITITILIFTSNNQRLLSTFDWEGDRGNIGRLIQWNYCINLTMDNPIMGAGAGVMSPIGFGDDIEIENGILRSCESGYLKVLAEYGIPIGILYSIALFTITYKTIKGRKYALTAPLTGSQYNAMLAACAAIFLQQMLNQTLESIWIGALFFGFLGYAVERQSRY
jgi:hypothetical protein